MLLSWDSANELVVRRKAESNGVGCAAATSRKAREVAHPRIRKTYTRGPPEYSGAQVSAQKTGANLGHQPMSDPLLRCCDFHYFCDIINGDACFAPIPERRSPPAPDQR